MKKKPAIIKLFWVEFFNEGGGGVREEDASLIWGYAEGYNFDVGVREYQKVENPCTTGIS